LRGLSVVSSSGRQCVVCARGHCGAPAATAGRGGGSPCVPLARPCWLLQEPWTNTSLPGRDVLLVRPGRGVLCNSSCTYFVTGHDFVQQRYYQCHTCLLDKDSGGRAACESCVRVCHAGHDLGPAQEGLFYCDCGAEGLCTPLAQARLEARSAAAALAVSVAVLQCRSPRR
jgi:hypothetical protein